MQLPDSYTAKNKWIASILETQDGNIWVGGPSGLAVYSQKNEIWYHYNYDREDPRSLSYNDVQVIYEDSRGILWVGTANGLNQVDRVSDEEIYFTRISKEDGLLNNVIYGF